MCDTPRTDEEVINVEVNGVFVQDVEADFARRLERENNALREQLQRAADELGCLPCHVASTVARIGDTNLDWQEKFDTMCSSAHRLFNALHNCTWPQDRDALSACGRASTEYSLMVSRLEASRKEAV